MVSLKKSESLIKYYIKVTCALKWARKLPRKTETYESAKCVPCNTRKCTHNGFVSDLLKWALKCRFYATRPWSQKFFLKIFSAWERERRLGRSGLDLQTHFYEDDSCQMRQSDQWQLSKHVLISRYFCFSGGRPQKHKPCSLRKRFLLHAPWDFRPQKTSPRILRLKFLKTTSMSIWSLPCSRSCYMYHVCSILQTIFLKQNLPQELRWEISSQSPR